jgi:hypothetical protein
MTWKIRDEIIYLPGTGRKKEDNMLKQLINFANELDKRGLRKEADYLDALLRKNANEPIDRLPMNYCVRKGDTLTSITETWSAGTATWMENAELNNLKEPYAIWPCQRLLVWTPPESQGMTGPSGPSHCPPECKED